MERDAEALRRRLYRPGASSADLDGYLRATEAERAEAPAPPPLPASTAPIRPFVIGVAVVAAAALVGGVLLTGGPLQPGRATATASAAAARDPDRPVFDGGERPSAHGSATEDGAGMYRYVVASGDTVAAIAQRFMLCTADVLDALPYGFDPAKLPAGESLELSHSASNVC